MAELYFLPQFKQVNLVAPSGITAIQTAGIKLSDVDGIDITKPGIICIDWALALDTAVAEWITYTSIDANNELVGVTRGQEGFSAKTHASNAVVAFTYSKSHVNNLNDDFLVAHNTDGTHKSGSVFTLPQFNDASSNHKYILAVSELLADRTVTLPLLTGNDEITFNAHTQTLNNKTLSTGSALNANASENFTYYSMSRQAIINGNFDVWQRGTSVALTDATVIYQADRWGDYNTKDGGTLPTLTRSRQLQTAGALQGSYYFTRLATNGAGTSLGANSLGEIFQRSENATRNLCGNGKKVTVSFYAKSDIANKKIGVALEQNYGTGGSPTAAEIITGTTFTLTSSWVKCTYTFTTNTLTGKTFGTANDDYLQLNLGYMWGSTRGTSFGWGSAETYVGSGNIDIAQVQVCAGDVALPFQPKSFEEELRACQRYYEKSFNYSVTPAQNTASDQAQEDVTPMTAWTNRVYFKVKKRATAPIITIFNPAAANANVRDLTAGADIAPTVSNNTENGFLIYGTAAAADRRLSFNWTSESEL